MGMKMSKQLSTTTILSSTVSILTIVTISILLVTVINQGVSSGSPNIRYTIIIILLVLFLLSMYAILSPRSSSIT